MSAGNGVFDVSPSLMFTTEQRLISHGIGCDLVCLSPPPLHIVPLFVFDKTEAQCTLPPSTASFIPLSSPRDHHSTVVPPGLLVFPPFLDPSPNGYFRVYAFFFSTTVEFTIAPQQVFAKHPNKAYTDSEDDEALASLEGTHIKHSPRLTRV